METFPIYHVLGPSWALDEPCEDRKCSEFGEADPAKRLGQALESRIEISLILAHIFIRYQADIIVAGQLTVPHIDGVPGEGYFCLGSNEAAG